MRAPTTCVPGWLAATVQLPGLVGAPPKSSRGHTVAEQGGAPTKTRPYQLLASSGGWARRAGLGGGERTTSNARERKAVSPPGSTRWWLWCGGGGLAGHIVGVASVVCWLPGGRPGATAPAAGGVPGALHRANESQRTRCGSPPHAAPAVNPTRCCSPPVTKQALKKKKSDDDTHASQTPLWAVTDQGCPSCWP